jgi:soluble lytic murein transglycosylase-like protein
MNWPSTLLAQLLTPWLSELLQALELTSPADGNLFASLLGEPLVTPPSQATAQSPTTPADLAAAFSAAAQATGLSPALLKAVAEQESGMQETAVSSAGAIGVMQLMPGTAADLGVDPYNAAQNIMGGARYLAELLHQFGSLSLALAAYNAGPEAVLRYGGIPPYAETERYVAAVEARLGSPNLSVEA